MPLDVRNKIVVIKGDLHEPALGLSAADRQRIVSEVEYVIHSAASISFFEHIHTLLEQNYEVGIRFSRHSGASVCMCKHGLPDVISEQHLHQQQRGQHNRGQAGPHHLHMQSLYASCPHRKPSNQCMPLRCMQRSSCHD